MGSRQSSLQFVFEFVEVSQIEAAVQRPPSHRQNARLFTNQGGVIEKRVQNLPDENQRCQNRIDQRQPSDVSAELVGQLVSQVRLLVLLPQVPRVLERRPRRPEKQQLDVVAQASRPIN